MSVGVEAVYLAQLDIKAQSLLGYYFALVFQLFLLLVISLLKKNFCVIELINISNL